MDPIILQGIFLNYVVLESLGEAAKVRSGLNSQHPTGHVGHVRPDI